MSNLVLYASCESLFFIVVLLISKVYLQTRISPFWSCVKIREKEFIRVIIRVKLRVRISIRALKEYGKAYLIVRVFIQYSMKLSITFIVTVAAAILLMF